MKRLRSYLRNNFGNDRLTCVVLLSVSRSIPIDIKSTRFPERHTRLTLFVDFKLYFIYHSFRYNYSLHIFFFFYLTVKIFVKTMMFVYWKKNPLLPLKLILNATWSIEDNFWLHQVLLSIVSRIIGYILIHYSRVFDDHNNSPNAGAA